MAKKRVIVDTNFMMVPGQFMIDVFSEIERLLEVPYELCFIDKSKEELNNLVSNGNEKERFAAKLALVLIIQKNLKSLPSSKEDKSVDDSIVKYADKDTLIATQDKLLRERVKAKGAKTIGLRQKKYLVVI
jgi:hypothetical protein